VANLDNLIRWQEFRPDIGENRRLKNPFFVKLAVGLTKPDLKRLAEAVDGSAATRPDDAPPLTDDETQAALEQRAEKLAAALSEFVRLGDEPLTVNGEAIDTLPKLLKLYARVAGGPVAMLELATALRWFNTAGGQTQLFFGRLSGGFASTEAEDQRAAR
jgi:hypothetical protein